MAGSTHYEVSIWGMDAIPGNPSRAVIAVALMQRLVVFESYLVGLVSAMVDPSTLPVGALKQIRCRLNRANAKILDHPVGLEYQLLVPCFPFALDGDSIP
jgi:hypothetical protein